MRLALLEQFMPMIRGFDAKATQTEFEAAKKILLEVQPKLSGNTALSEQLGLLKTNPPQPLGNTYEVAIDGVKRGLGIKR
jgi:hypothetical protein